MSPENAEDYARRARRFLLVLFGLGINGALLAYCVQVLMMSRSTDQRQWTMATLMGIGSGVLGYGLGRSRRGRFTT